MVQYLPFFVTESQIVVKKCSPVFCSSVSCYPAFMHPDLRRRVWAHMKSGLMKGLCNMFSIKNPRYKILEENYLLDQQEYRSFGIQYDGGCERFIGRPQQSETIGRSVQPVVCIGKTSAGCGRWFFDWRVTLHGYHQCSDDWAFGTVEDWQGVLSFSRFALSGFLFSSYGAEQSRLIARWQEYPLERLKDFVVLQSWNFKIRGLEFWQPRMSGSQIFMIS